MTTRESLTQEQAAEVADRLIPDHPVIDRAAMVDFYTFILMQEFDDDDADDGDDDEPSDDDDDESPDDELVDAMARLLNE